MNIVIIVFMVIATIFALSSLGYVAVDVVLEVKSNKQEKKEEKPEPIVVAAPVIDIEPEPEVLPDIVECIDAEEADSMISDDLAMRSANYEKGAGHGKVGIINIGVIDKNFTADDTVTISLLKQKGLVPKNVGRIKVLANGMINKPLTIKAENYSVQAIKMIELTGGTVIILKD